MFIIFFNLSLPTLYNFKYLSLLYHISFGMQSPRLESQIRNESNGFILIVLCFCFSISRLSKKLDLLLSISYLMFYFLNIPFSVVLALNICLMNFNVKLYSDIGKKKYPKSKIKTSRTPPNSPIKSKMLKTYLV